MDKKGSYVEKNDRIDNDDARAGAAERVVMIDDGGTTLIQTQTYVPGKDTFKPFETFPTHVDIFLEPSGFSESRDKDGPKAIQFSGVVGIFTVGDYPLQGEGNILVSRGKGPGTAEPPPEKHWAEKVDALVPVPDLVIHHGLAGTGGKGGAAVPEDLEDGDVQGHGAFTVAHLNDTDNDGKVDASAEDKSIQKKGENGRDEIDLMQLELKVTIPKDGGIAAPLPANVQNQEVVLTVSGPVLLWEHSTKEKMVEAPYKWKVKDMPAVVWVEATAPSAKVRDTSIEMTLGTASDKVLATAVWAVRDSFRNQGNTLSDDANDPALKETFRVQYGGTLGLTIAPAPVAIQNAQESQFLLSPPGAGMETLVNWDPARKVEEVSWDWPTGAPVGFAVPPGYTNFSVGELPNDESNGRDEDNIPFNDHIYRIDGPGWRVVRALVGSQHIQRLNAEEFVRVLIGEEFPRTQAGQNQIIGSRSSLYYDWYSRTDVTADRTNTYARTPGGDNQITEGRPAAPGWGNGGINNPPRPIQQP